MKAIILAVSLIGLVGVAACTEGHPPPQTPGSGHVNGAVAPGPRTCPLGVDNATVYYEEIEGGAALLFVPARAEQLADLRERAANASAVHGPGERLGKGHEGTHAHGGEHGLKAMQLPPVRVGAVDVEGAVRIVFGPADPADLDNLRKRLQVRAHELMAGCT